MSKLPITAIILNFSFKSFSRFFWFFQFSVKKYRQTNTRNVISSKFYIENDYLDVFLGCFIALENRNSLIFELIEKKPKKSQCSEKLVPLVFSPPRLLKSSKKYILIVIFDVKFAADHDPGISFSIFVKENWQNCQLLL